MFGPTTGDRVRLADTELWIEVEKDCTVYGEEVKFGGDREVFGLNRLTEGAATPDRLEEALARALAGGYEGAS